ncbi:MAG: diguanylate cyclase [Candidatus Hydrogenedens sp.]|nr:diguanylate cyclase [Candidatus Hydrogenedens sp.]
MSYSDSEHEDFSDDSHEAITAFHMTWSRGVSVLFGLVFIDAASYVIIKTLPPMSFWAEMLIGSLILVAFVVPLLYISLLRRFEHNIRELKNMESRLRQTRFTLRERVREKTVELEAANNQLVRIISQLESNIRDQTLLGEMSDMLQSCATPEEAYGVFAEFAQRMCPGTTGALCVIAPSRNLVQVAASWGDAAHLNKVFSPNDCWALRRGAPYASGAGHPAITCQHTEARENEQYWCVPLNAQGDAIGVLNIAAMRAGNEEEQEAREQRIARVAANMADDAAIALANLRLREKLHNQSIRDGLTQLFNRRYMEEILELEIQRAIRSESEVAVVMLDVDHFKQFNDTYGHSAGDAVLRNVAHMLQQGVRSSDVACRYGGEEFTLVLSNTEPEEARRRCEDLRNAIAGLVIEENGHQLGSITASMGISMFPKHASEVKDLLRIADDALYEAKEGGRNRVVLAHGTGNAEGEEK